MIVTRVDRALLGDCARAQQVNDGRVDWLWFSDERVGAARCVLVVVGYHVRVDGERDVDVGVVDVLGEYFYWYVCRECIRGV